MITERIKKEGRKIAEELKINISEGISLILQSEQNEILNTKRVSRENMPDFSDDLDYEEIIEQSIKSDDNGNPIYYKYKDGAEVWQAFDSNNFRIFYKDSYGNQKINVYDRNGNELYRKDDDEEYIWEYDSFNNLKSSSFFNEEGFLETKKIKNKN